MSQPRIKWGNIKRFCDQNGYVIKGSGGDKIIIAPKGSIPTGPQSRHTVTIGHKCCANKGSEVYEAYVSALKRAFGITRKQLKDA